MDSQCITVCVCCTTGASFQLRVARDDSVESLRRRLALRLRVPGERLALLHNHKRLTSGRLGDFGISDGSKLTLVPSVQAGLMSHNSKPVQSVMKALESLTETQVSDFLCGRCPLTLALRFGDHAMFVQLQLAAQQRRGVAVGSVSPPTSTSHAHRTTPTGPRTPGAVIDSFVSRAPGVFSGTFSGTLHPGCQDGHGRPRKDMGTVLHILTDLLSATRTYAGAAPRQATTAPAGHTHTCQTGERDTENQATRCKLERLQRVMQQRRLRRKARRDSRAPYTWSPTRGDTCDKSLQRDSCLWKPDVTADDVAGLAVLGQTVHMELTPTVTHTFPL